jgi:hypothetical protein
MDASAHWVHDQQQCLDLLRQVSKLTNRWLVAIAEEATLTGVRRLDPRLLSGSRRA